MLRAIFTGIAIIALVGPAAAAPKAKAKTKAPAAIEISNKRTVALAAFQIAAAGEDGKVIGKLAKPLAAGAKTRIKLTGGKGCEYVARWQFEDAGDEGPVDLCHDAKIVLTD